MNKSVLIVAACIGALSVILGAFGAHGLKNLVSLEMVQTFETGVRYQMYHALFLLFVGGTEWVTTKVKKTILYLVCAGLVLFSGSIYGLSTNTLTSFDFKTIGFITPIGGALLISAWIVLGIHFFRKQNL